jgi:hypothetical protein
VGILEKISAACSSPDPNASLEQLVKELAMQGFTRQEIYEMFYNIRISSMYSHGWLLLEEKYNNQHPLDSIIDRLAGFCNPSLTLLSHQNFCGKEGTHESYNFLSQDRPRVKPRKRFFLTMSQLAA